MTVLSSPAPTLSSADNFKLTYNGTYAKVVFDRATNANHIEEVKGPLPKNRFVWDGVDYLGGLEAGESKLVPFDLVRVFFGDPRSTPKIGQRTEDRKGQVGDVAPRENEIRRLATLYGLYSVDAGLLPQTVPDVTITTAEDAQIITPAMDPDGEHVYGHLEDSAEVHDVATLLEKMRGQIKVLEDQQKALDAKGGRNDGADVTQDGPPAAKK